MSGRQVLYIIFLAIYYVPAVSIALVILNPIAWGALTLWGVVLSWLIVYGPTSKVFDSLVEELDKDV